MAIEKQYVSSSNIEALGYEEETQTLRVWFLTGSAYDYANVSNIEFDALLCAPSIGAYYNRNIKNSYSYTKVQ